MTYGSQFQHSACVHQGHAALPTPLEVLLSFRRFTRACAKDTPVPACLCTAECAITAHLVLPSSTTAFMRFCGQCNSAVTIGSTGKWHVKSLLAEHRHMLGILWIHAGKSTKGQHARDFVNCLQYCLQAVDMEAASCVSAAAIFNGGKAYFCLNVSWTFPGSMTKSWLPAVAVHCAQSFSKSVCNVRNHEQIVCSEIHAREGESMLMYLPGIDTPWGFATCRCALHFIY